MADERGRLSPGPLIVATSTARPGRGVGEAAMAWLVARGCVALGFSAAAAIADTLHAHGAARLHVHQGLDTWDGARFWSIARFGYDAASPAQLRFFPLYPMLARGLAWPIGHHVGLTLIAIANVSAFAGLVLLRQLVLDETGDPALARRSMWMLALFPAGFALVFSFAEPLLLALSLVAFLAIRRRRWWVAALAGVLCGLTAPVGVLLVVPFAIEALTRRQRRAAVTARVATVASPAVGMVLYLLWVGGEFGDWLTPLKSERAARGGIRNPFTRVYDGIRHLSSSRLDAPALAFAAVLVILAVVAARTQRPSWTAYAVVTLVVALSAGDIGSVGRYGLVAFPFAVAAARLGDDERLAWASMALAAGALVALTGASTLGAYRP